MDAGHDRTACPASSGVGRIEDYWHCLHRRSVEMGDFCPRRSHRSPGKIHHGQLSGVDHDRISLRSVYGAPDYSKFVRDTATRSLSIAKYDASTNVSSLFRTTPLNFKRSGLLCQKFRIMLTSNGFTAAVDFRRRAEITDLGQRTGQSLGTKRLNAFLYPGHNPGVGVHLMNA